MLSEIVGEVTAQLRVLNILEHFLNGGYDPLGIGALELPIEEFLHVVVLCRGETEFLGLISGSLVLNHGKTAHGFDRTTFFYV